MSSDNSALPTGEQIRPAIYPDLQMIIAPPDQVKTTESKEPATIVKR